MGYTTQFQGEFRFTLEGPLTLEIAQAINHIHSPTDVSGPTPWPDGYCQWELTRDLGGIRWDQGEKFYNYVEWLQAILDNILKPAGVGLALEVRYQGDDVGDSGILRIDNGVVVKEELGPVITDLKAFRNFVLASEYGDELVERYRRSVRS